MATDRDLAATGARDDQDGSPHRRWSVLPYVAIPCGLLLLYCLSFMPVMYLAGVGERNHWRWLSNQEHALGAVYYPHFILMKRSEAYFTIAVGAFRLGNPSASIPTFAEWSKRPLP